ncbi:hypothetical protein [Streptomyces sp. NPDC093225]|uniref:hypothetical protein n=1 Tax=Streptomyces sp. NPDC093225 TaxID=3366034 RepID=UPI00380AAC0C
MQERKERDIAPACTTKNTTSSSPVFIGVPGSGHGMSGRQAMSRRSSWESRKHHYWSDCTGNSLRASRRIGHPAPPAADAQALLESWVLEQLGLSPDLSAHPFGVASLTCSAASLTLHLDPYLGRERHSFPEHCLHRLLPAAPAPGSGDELGGIPGLRVGGTEAGGRKLRLHMVDGLGPAQLTLALPPGLPETWPAVERRHRSWVKGHGMRPLWATPWLDYEESDYLDACLARARSARATMGSALLRRLALFHTSAAFYRVRCWDEGDTWKIDACTANPSTQGHDQLLQRLCHPRWGLPVNLAHAFCHCAGHESPYAWGHTCAFYLDGLEPSGAEAIYLRVHASPEGRDHDRQIETLRRAGAPKEWMDRAFPTDALQDHRGTQRR